MVPGKVGQKKIQGFLVEMSLILAEMGEFLFIVFSLSFYVEFSGF